MRISRCYKWTFTDESDGQDPEVSTCCVGLCSWLGLGLFLRCASPPCLRNLFGLSLALWWRVEVGRSAMDHRVLVYGEKFFLLQLLHPGLLAKMLNGVCR